MAIIKGAEPFLFKGGKYGVILVHGFTGSPSHMRPLGQFLNRQGFTVFGPRLCGHGTSREDMAKTTWPDWYSSVEDGYHLLGTLCDYVHIVGLSLGGLLSLKLAAAYPLCGIVAINTPIFIADKRLPLLPLLPLYRLFRDYIPKNRRKLDVNPLLNISYEYTPLACLSSLLELAENTRSVLPQVYQPALIIQSRNEPAVDPQSAQYLYDKINSRDKQLLWLERSGHLATIDSEHQLVFDHIADFLGALNQKIAEEEKKCKNYLQGCGKL